MEFPKPWADAVARLRVPSGFLLVLSFAWLAQPTVQSLLYGVPVPLTGLALRAWAAGHLAKNERLATGGPYAYIRNPLYAGTLLVAAGLVASARRWELAILFAAVFTLIYLPVIQNEEQHLAKLFPGFADYYRRTGLLIPRSGGRPRAREEAGPFEWRLYRRNEEYNALLGYLAGLAWLIWRTTV